MYRWPSVVQTKVLVLPESTTLTLSVGAAVASRLATIKMKRLEVSKPLGKS